MAKMQSDQEFVETTVKALVNVPDKVSTERTVDEMGVLITIKVAPEDMGILIGRQGQNARALRTLARVVGAKNNARVNLRIEEPEGGRRPPRVEGEAPASAPAVASTPAPRSRAKVEKTKDVEQAVKDLEL